MEIGTFTIPGAWTPLADIIGSAFDPALNYRIDCQSSNVMIIQVAGGLPDAASNSGNRLSGDGNPRRSIRYYSDGINALYVRSLTRPSVENISTI